MQKEQTALARTQIQPETLYLIVLDVLIIARKTTALGLFRIQRRKKNPLFPILKKKKNISRLFQETEKHT